MGRHSPRSHKGREPTEGSMHNIISSSAQNLNFQKSPRVGDTPALRCSGGEVRGSPWSDRVGSGSTGPKDGGTNCSQAQEWEYGWEQWDSGQLSALCGHKQQTLCSHGAQFLGLASKGQEWEDTLPGRKSTGLHQGSP